MPKKLIGVTIILVIGLGVFLLINLSNSKQLNQEQAINQINDKKTGEKGLTQEEVENGLEIQNNGAEGSYVVNHIEGEFQGDVEGVVRTDTNCTPDEEGISRCHNDIELNDEMTVKIVNPHNMKKNRCLQPGETVQLSKSENNKTIVKPNKL